MDSAVAIFINEIAKTAADERVSIVTFASNISNSYCGALPAATLDQPLTSSTSAMQASMEKLATSVWNGNTNIAAGIDLSHKELVGGSNARKLADKYMLVLTDGMENEGSAIEKAKEAARSRIKISTVTFGSSANQTLMKEVAAIGGGVHYHADNAAQLANVFRQFAAQTALIIQ